jgi:small nuclear ribonucleoprotein (snRNP)-like protein
MPLLIVDFFMPEYAGETVTVYLDNGVEFTGVLQFCSVNYPDMVKVILTKGNKTTRTVFRKSSVVAMQVVV